MTEFLGLSLGEGHGRSRWWGNIWRRTWIKWRNKSGGKVAQTEVVATAKSLKPTTREYYLFIAICLPSSPLPWVHSGQNVLPPPTLGLGVTFLFAQWCVGMDVIKSHLSRIFECSRVWFGLVSSVPAFCHQKNMPWVFTSPRRRHPWDTCEPDT